MNMMKIKEVSNGSNGRYASQIKQVIVLHAILILATYGECTNVAYKIAVISNITALNSFPYIDMKYTKGACVS